MEVEDSALDLVETESLSMYTDFQEVDKNNEKLIEIQQNVEQIVDERNSLLHHIDLGIKSFELFQQWYNLWLQINNHEKSELDQQTPDFNEYCINNLLMAIDNHLTMLKMIKNTVDERGIIGAAIEEAYQLWYEIG